MASNFFVMVLFIIQSTFKLLIARCTVYIYFLPCQFFLTCDNLHAKKFAHTWSRPLSNCPLTAVAASDKKKEEKLRHTHTLLACRHIIINHHYYHYHHCVCTDIYHIDIYHIYSTYTYITNYYQYSYYPEEQFKC